MIALLTTRLGNARCHGVREGKGNRKDETADEESLQSLWL